MEACIMPTGNEGIAKASDGDLEQRKAWALADIDKYYGKTGTYGLSQESYTDHLTGVLLCHVCIIREALQPAPSLLETACQWAIKNSYATGHADNIVDLLYEIEWQAKKRGGPLVDAIGKEYSVQDAEAALIKPSRTTGANPVTEASHDPYKDFGMDPPWFKTEK